jgi:hypothetical protein
MDTDTLTGASPGTAVAPERQEDIVSDALDSAAEICAPADGVPFFAAVMVADQNYEPWELEAAWGRFADKLRIFRALDTGAMHWSERHGEDVLRLACDEERPTEAAMQETAVQLACAAADEARHQFLNGAQL